MYSDAVETMEKIMHMLTVLFHEWGGDLGYNLTKICSAKRLCITQRAVIFTPMISLRNKVVIELEEYSDKRCVKETNATFRKYLPSSAIRDLETLIHMRKFVKVFCC